MKTILFTTIIRTARLAAGRWFMITALLCATGLRAAEPTFTNVTATVAPGLPGLEGSSVAWGDYDNDGRLDFLITGYDYNAHASLSQLWRNTGSGFANVTAAVAPGLPGGVEVAWGDYDDDGRLDFFLSGSGIWRNTGSGFTNVTATVAPGLSGGYGALAWADYDNDRRLDFLFAGSDRTELWRNTENGFTNVTASVAPGLPGLRYASVAWGDYDNDGLLDFLLTGADGLICEECDPVTRFSQLWRNTGNGFVNVTASVAPGLPGLVSPVAWGDYDNDGRLDFLVGSLLWRNTGSGFTNVTAAVAPGLPYMGYDDSGSVAWGDYDNDGRLDFLISGRLFSQVWRNTGNGFTNVTASVAPGLPQVLYSSLAWGDYDNDGRLDFLITGSLFGHCDGCDQFGAVSQLWRNQTGGTNPPPSVITASPSDVSQTSVMLNGRINPHGHPSAAWFVWGDSTNYGHVTAAQPMGNGNSFSNFSETISGLSTGVTYFYRAVGSNNQGQLVAGFEQRFTLAVPGVTTNPATGLGPTSATLNAQVNPNNLPSYGWFEWGPTPAYGQLTPAQLLAVGFDTGFSQRLSGLQAGTTYFFRAVASNTLGVAYGAAQSLVTPTFVNVTAMVAPYLPAVYGASVAWGDYDNDGRLDFLLTGLYDDDGEIFVSQIWRNTGSGFTNVTASVAPGLPGVAMGSVAWGDYDNDGRLDFFLTGYTSSGREISQVWRNTGSGFSNVTATVAPGLQGVHSSSVAWGDYDNDGRLDFLITGVFFNSNNGFDESISQIWRNTGSGFTNVTATVAPGLPGIYYSSVAWGDYDNDGRLDLLLTGVDIDGPTVSQIWRNTGSRFTNVTDTVAPGLPGVYVGSAVWGDYDNDGRLDFLLTGAFYKTNFSFVSELWRNTGSGFANVTASAAPGLSGVDSTPVVWADYDNDGRLDFFAAKPHFGGKPQLWRNYTPVSNTPPSAPTGLAMTATTNAVMLSWNSATDDQTPASGLTYNIRAGTTPGGNNLLSAHVNATNGFRRVSAMGNAMLRHSLPLTGVTNGQTVYWSVQAVDSAFAGGPFATETSVVSLPVLSVSLNSEWQSARTSTLSLSWAPPTFGWVLQQNPGLGASNWITTANDSANPSTLPATNGAQFYRLSKP